KPFGCRAGTELTPAEQWLHLWSSARYDLGLSDDDFYSLTPRQLNALFRHRERQRDYDREHTEYMAAQIVAMVANTGFRSFEKAREPREFMPSAWGKTTQKTTMSTA